MTIVNREAFLFFAWIHILLLWGFSATALARPEQRFIPIVVIGVALAIAFLYVVDKANDAETLDKKLFKQASIVFFITCLIEAT